MTSVNYVDFLINEYLRRKGSEASYSERSFAKSLGLSSGYLKLLFQGKRKLSFKRAQVISDRLNWTQARKHKFLTQVKSDSAKDSVYLRGKIVLKPDEFFEVSDWFNFALVEFIKIKKEKVTYLDIMRGLKISATEAKYALKHLARIGLIHVNKDGSFKVPDKYEIPTVSSAGIRKYHTQVLQLALAAIDKQYIENREFRSLTLAFDVNKMQEAKKSLEKFVAEFEKKFGGGDMNAVYQLNTNFFRLDHPQEKL